MTPDVAIEPPRAASRTIGNAELAAIYKRVGERISDVRESMGASQRAACEAVLGAATRQGEWSRWERGLVLPNIATLHQIAVWGGVSLAELGLFEPAEAISAADLSRIREHLTRALEIAGGSGG